MEEKKNTGKNILIVVLVILLIAASAFIAYLLGKNDSPKVENKENEVIEEKKEDLSKINKDANFYVEYLEPFTKCYGLSVLRNNENFKDNDIFYFILQYYIDKALSENVESLDGLYKYSVPVEEVDTLVNKYFNVKSYNIVNSIEDGTTSIRKDGNNYSINWNAKGCENKTYKYNNLEFNGDEIIVSYSINNGMCFDDESCTKIGEAKFYLKYNNGNYNLIKIVE